MELKQLQQTLEEVNSSVYKKVVDIEFEDYNGNTIFKLSDLDLADIDGDCIRLQSKKQKTIGIVNVNLEYEIPEGENPEEYLQNVELPKEYVEDSYEFVKIIKE